MGIRKRNLENDLVQWIQEQSGLPLGIGDVKYVAATAAWRQHLLDNGFGPQVYSNPKTAYDACTASQNDCVVVFPGVYDFGDVWTWAKNSTHMICVGPVGMTNHPVVLCHTLDSTETLGQIIITADNCFFKNFKVQHKIGSTSAVGAVVNVNFKGCSNVVCDHVQFMNAGDTLIGNASGHRGVKFTGAKDLTFRNCVFGGTGTIQRTDTGASSDLWMIPDSTEVNSDSALTASAYCRNLRFYGCAWETEYADSDSKGAAHQFIRASDTRIAFKGLIHMEDCVFAGVLGATGVIAEAIDLDSQLVAHGRILMKNPLAVGVTALSTDSECLFISAGGWDSGLAGTGLAIKPTA